MEKLILLLIFVITTLDMAASQTDAPPYFTQFTQKNPSFHAFLKQNPNISQLLQSNPELIHQFELNPKLVNQTEEHAKFLNTFLQETTNLNQIIKDNPKVYAFILKQVDHAVETGQNSTIVIQMTEADVNEAQKELEALKNPIEQGPNTGSNREQISSNVTNQMEQKQSDDLAGLSREQLLALLTKQQSGVKQSLEVPTVLPGTNENTLLHQTSLPKQQSNPAETVPLYTGQKPSGVQSSGHFVPVDPEQHFNVFNTQSKPGTVQTTNSIKTSNDLLSGGNNGALIDPNNLEDLMRLKMLYIAMYNAEAKSIQDLQDFYNVILAKLNVRTRKQVAEFLNKFKTSNTVGKSNASKFSSLQPNSNGIAGYTSNTIVSGNADGYSSSNGVIRRPSLRERILQCKLRKYCRFNGSSPICRQQAAEWQRMENGLGNL